MAADPYRWIARWYDAVFEPALVSAKKLGRRLYLPKPPATILDIGCGTGSQLDLYRGTGCALVGIDPSPAMVARARDRLGSDARVDLGDASRLPCPDASVDLILLSMTLHELAPTGRVAVLSEAARALGRDGRMLVLDYHPGPLSFPRGWLTKPVILLAELSAGLQHFRHHLEFLASGGTPALATRQGLLVETQRVIKGGNFGLFLLRLPGTGVAERPQ